MKDSRANLNPLLVNAREIRDDDKPLDLLGRLGSHGVAVQERGGSNRGDVRWDGRSLDWPGDDVGSSNPREFASGQCSGGEFMEALGHGWERGRRIDIRRDPDSEGTGEPTRMYVLCCCVSEFGK